MIPAHWRRPFASPFPNERQAQVLTAIFAPDAGARSAFAVWRKTLDLQGPFDHEVFRLLPLLYLRLCELKIEDDLMPRLKGVYRHAWVQNLCLLHETTPAVAALEQAGVPTLMLKGAALAFSANAPAAARPMADLDVAIPKDRLAEAIRVLETAGWSSRALNLGATSISHAAAFRNMRGAEFDLHWHVLMETSRTPVEDCFWKTAKPFALNGVATRTLDPALALLHALVHGLRTNPVPPVRWVADAITVIRQTKDLDWNLLLTMARVAQVTQRVRLGLVYLAESFDATVPVETLKALNASTPHLFERIETAAVLSETRSLTGNVLTKPLILLSDYFRQSEEKGLRQIPGFVRYIRRRLTMTSSLASD